MVVYKGETMPLVALSEKTGVPYQRLHERIVRRNWAVEDAVNKPPKGYLIMAAQWSEKLKLAVASDDGRQGGVKTVVAVNVTAKEA